MAAAVAGAVTDIFGSQVEFGDSWVLDGNVLKIEGADDLIVNSASIQYNRPLNKIMPLNSSKQFIVAGRGSGTITLGMIVGPGKALSTFLTKFRDPCEIKTNTLTLTPTSKVCGGGSQPTAFKASFCLLQGINTSVQSGEMAIVGAGMTLTIGALELI
jgi:hypothetical protein